MDYKHLVTAEEAMRKVLDEINASTRNRQTMVLLSKLQPNLTWVKEVQYFRSIFVSILGV